jgi:hypothetical protein
MNTSIESFICVERLSASWSRGTMGNSRSTSKQ